MDKRKKKDKVKKKKESEKRKKGGEIWGPFPALKQAQSESNEEEVLGEEEEKEELEGEEKTAALAIESRHTLRSLDGYETFLSL